LGDQLRFSLEAADEIWLVRVLRQNDFYCHLTLNLLLASTVDRALGTLAELFQQIIAFDRA